MVKFIHSHFKNFPAILLHYIREWLVSLSTQAFSLHWLHHFCRMSQASSYPFCLIFVLITSPVFRIAAATTSRPLRTSTASLLKHPFMPPVANHTKSDMKWVAMMAVFSLSTMAIVLVVVLSVNRCSPKKHCRSVKSGSFSSECTQVTRLWGALMR